MVGYELISGQGDICASATILLTGLGFVVSSLSMYYHGMGGYGEAQDWNNMPIIKWEKRHGEWEQIMYHGLYKDYQTDEQYTYKWIPLEQQMGFIQDRPPAECHVFCSPGMRKRVDEILLTVPKETYN